jgi:hypothetical protein
VAEPVWATVPDIAEALGTDVLKVRQHLRDGALIGIRGEDGVLRIPADFAGDGKILKGLPGLIVVLRDNGYDDEAAVRWLYEEDDSLPGHPVQALLENRGTEVKRRAQALGW